MEPLDVTDDRSPWLTVDEAAEYLRCSVKSIRNYIARGDLAAYRLKGSRFLRVRRSDLDDQLVRVSTEDRWTPP